MSGRNILKLVASLVACEMAGLIGMAFTTSQIPTWYAALHKPSFTPPDWLFAPVWNTLYLLVAVAAFLVWRKGLGNPGVSRALITFLAQLFLNALWPVVFFGLQSIFGGAVVILGLLILILFTIVRFDRVSSIAGRLLVPYALWVAFASALNVGIWLLNP